MKSLNTNLPHVFKGLTFLFSVVGLLSMLNIVYLRPWNNPELAQGLQEITHSNRHAPVIVSTARILEKSVPVKSNELASKEIPATTSVFE